MGKAMKAMKKKPISAKLARRHLLAGKIAKTKSGYTAAAFKKTKTGKIVSKKRSTHAKAVLGGWTAAVQKARKALNSRGLQLSRRALHSTRRPRSFTANEGSESSSMSLSNQLQMWGFLRLCSAGGSVLEGLGIIDERC